MLRSEINSILASAGLRPQHKFGQNFMVDQNILRAIADSGGIQPSDIVLEVGPGVGNLTRLLAQRARHVVAVDIDTKLLPAAQRHHAALTNITWINADILAGKHQINPDVIATLRTLRAQNPAANLKLVSNLPYNAASPIIAELLVLMCQQLQTPKLETGNWKLETLTFSLLAFTVQHEVALRMVAAEDTSDYGPLGILIQLTADAKILRKIPPGAFWPPPKVNSALVAVTPNLEKMARIPNILALQSLLSGLFSHRRQTLHNALKHYLGDAYTPALVASIESAHINLKLRPEAIPLESFLTLAKLTHPG